MMDTDSDPNQINLQAWMNKESKRASVRKRIVKLDSIGQLSTESEDGTLQWEINIRQYPIVKGEREFEMIVKLPTGPESYFCSSQEEYDRWLEVIERANKLQFLDVYDLHEMLGEGAFAQVFKGVRRIDSREVAVKIIEKTDPEELEYIIAECNLMKSISHPHVVKTYDVFDAPDRIHLVMERMEGGELFDMIASAGKFSEKNAASIMKQLCLGLDYLHQLNFVHRDIKPENVLCTSKNWPLTVKICDFGLAAPMIDGQVDEEGIIGTPGYVAPEMVKRQPYGPPVDMWGVGVLLYIMLSGKMPFYGKDDRECLRKIAYGMYNMPSREWNNVSDEAKSLVKALLQVEPGKRLTARTVLLHKWMETASDKPIENDLSGIHSSRRKLRKVVNIAIMLNRLNNSLGKLPSIGDPNSAQKTAPTWEGNRDEQLH